MDDLILDEIEQTIIEAGLDVPEKRRRDIGWLERNLAIRNSGTPECRLILLAIRVDTFNQLKAEGII